MVVTGFLRSGIGLLLGEMLGMGATVSVTAGLLLATGFHTGVGFVVSHWQKPPIKNIWWFCSGLNRRPRDYEPLALTN